MNHLKISNSQKLSCLLALPSIWKVSMGLLVLDVTDGLLSILFCYYCFIVYGWQQPSIQETSKKNTKRTRTQKKSLIILHRFLDKNTSAFKPLSLKGRIKFQKNWIGGEIPSENLWGKPRWDGIFSFSFSHDWLSW